MSRTMIQSLTSYQCRPLPKTLHMQKKLRNSKHNNWAVWLLVTQEIIIDRPIKTYKKVNVILLTGYIKDAKIITNKILYVL